MSRDTATNAREGNDLLVMAHHLARRHRDPQMILNWIDLNASP